MRKQLLSLAVLGFLAACSSTAVVPAANVSLPATDKVPGHYAVLVQSGGWDIKAEIVGHQCFMYKYDTDINPAYSAAIKEGLDRSLERVTFIDTNLTPDQLASGGYDGQIVIMQGSATGKATVISGFLSASAKAGVELSGIMAVTIPGGRVQQQSVTGEGTGEAGIFFCPDIGNAIGPAAAQAVEAFVKDAVNQSRTALQARAQSAEAK